MRLPKLLGTATFRLALLQGLLFALCAGVLYGVVYTSVASFARQQLEAAITTEMSSLAGEDDPAGRERRSPRWHTARSRPHPGMARVAGRRQRGDAT